MKNGETAITRTIIQIDKSAQNCILLYGGANQSLTKEYIDEVLSHFDKGDLFLLQRYPERIIIDHV